jgi:hypothetical protein
MNKEITDSRKFFMVGNSGIERSLQPARQFFFTFALKDSAISRFGAGEKPYFFGLSQASRKRKAQYNFS